MRRGWSLLLVLLLLPGVPVGAQRPVAPLRAERFAVATADLLASQVGAEILRAGGNAADAAVAAALALGVMNPWNSGIGGGGFALVYRASDRSATFLDFRETAPAAATRDMFVRGGRADPALSRRGGLAVAVPGEVAGLAALSRRFGRIPLAEAAAPAIRIAERGFPVRAAPIARSFREGPPEDPGLARLLFPGGLRVAQGTRVRNVALARTLRAIASHGANAFYRGRIARAIVAAVRARGGVLSRADLSSYRVRARRPLRGVYRDLPVLTAPLPSSGGVALLEALAILERHDPRGLGPGSAERLHLVAESLKPAFADRAHYLGDTEEAEAAVRRLLDPVRLRARAGRVALDRVIPASGWSALREGPRDGGTTHLSVVDGEGNAVALTSTVNLGFGAQITAGDTGIVLNDQMDDFTAEPGVPNVFGLLQSEANSIAPGRRPLSSMSPTIVLGADGRPILVVGASGGPRIISATLQVLLAVIDFRLDAAAALALPRIHHQWMPDRLFIEPEVPADVCRDLSSRGHRIQRAPRLGVAQAVVVRRGGGRVRIEAASDPRGGGAPAGE